jgi:hypothetical protein
MRRLQWDEFQHENSNTWEDVWVCEMSSRSNQKRKERWFRVFVKSVQWFEFAMSIFSLITFLHRWEIADCARSCFDELSSSEKLSIQYFEHVVNFMQNTVKIIHRLLFLSFELQVLILKLASRSTKESDAQRIFERIFRVRCKHVEIWLKFLIEHHSDYKKIELDSNRLTQMSKDESINCSA